MARTKAMLGPGARLSDYHSASLLERVFPLELVHEVCALEPAHGQASQLTLPQPRPFQTVGRPSRRLARTAPTKAALAETEVCG